MDSIPGSTPEPVLLIIADISGYTRYMTANAKTLAHSQTIITELVKTIVKQSELPLEVAKLEGDAIFMYCRKLNGAQPWPEAKRIIGERLFAFFRAFGRKVRELGRSTTCDCNACTHIEKLRLKIVVHSGEALFHQVLNFVELAGVDVIIAHRLLKNSIAASQYLLLTEAARLEVVLPENIQLIVGRENYEDIGQVSTHVYLPDGGPAPAAPVEELSFTQRYRQSWSLYCQLWFAPFAKRPNPFRNIASSGSAFGRTGFAWLTALLTPLFLPIGAVFVFFHALKSDKPAHHKHDGHVHKADGSCCHEH